MIPICRVENYFPCCWCCSFQYVSRYQSFWNQWLHTGDLQNGSDRYALSTYTNGDSIVMNTVVEVAANDYLEVYYMVALLQV